MSDNQDTEYFHKKHIELLEKNINRVIKRQEDGPSYKRYDNNPRVLTRSKYQNYLDTKLLPRKRFLYLQCTSNHAQLLTYNQHENPIYDDLYDREQTIQDAPTNFVDELLPKYDNYICHVQCGVDEAGRGPLFGRVYAACVVFLPPSTMDFNHPFMEYDYDEYITMLSSLKDSKCYTSHAKLIEAAEFIKNYSFTFAIEYIEPEEIDSTNIRVSTHKAMNNAVEEVRKNINIGNTNSMYVYKPNDLTLAIIDGCDFNKSEANKDCEHICVEGGDNLFIPIAAASILAKTARDQNLIDLCEEYPYLKTHFNLHKHKGYGTKLHLEAIHNYGITKWHRKTFGKCRGRELFNTDVVDDDVDNVDNVDTNE